MQRIVVFGAKRFVVVQIGIFLANAVVGHDWFALVKHQGFAPSVLIAGLVFADKGEQALGTQGIDTIANAQFVGAIMGHGGYFEREVVVTSNKQFVSLIVYPTFAHI